MPEKIKVKALIFDFDNTLVDTHSAINAAYDFLFDKISKKYNIPEEKLFDEAHWAEQDLITNVPLERRLYDRKMVIKKMSDELSLGITEEELNQFGETFYRFIKEKIYFPEYTEDTLKTLKARGKKLGLLTDTDAKPGFKKERLDEIGFTRLFDVVMIAGETIPQRKNSPIPFIELARLLGEQPSDIAAVGDRMDADVQNAKESGMKAILMDAFLKPNEGRYTPDYIIHDIRELLDIIE